MNTDTHQDQDTRGCAQDGFLDDVERAVAQKIETGHADETRYGFVAQIANARPPLDEAFQRTLRARIMAEARRNTRKKKRIMTTRPRLQVISLGRLLLAGTLAALLVLALARTFARIPGVEPSAEAPAPTAAPAPQLAAGDVDALVSQLNNEEIPAQTVVVFPADHAATLAERTRHPVVPLVLGDDLSPMALQAALGAVLPPSGLVDVILVNQEMTGLARQVRIMLEQRLYRLDKAETFGALERNRFVVGPEDAPLEPIGARFEGGIELVAGGVLGDLLPGEPLPLAFDWRVTQPVDDSPVMFAHLVHSQGGLVAQRDAVPGNGLFPVESWEPGELVRDQFALPLPPDLQAGEYELQIGIYSPATGQRYNVVEPEAGPYVVVQQLTVEE
jgi:hypothetical protein